MLEFLKIIHFLSFSVAIGAGVANIIVGLRIGTLPPAALPQIGAIRLSFGKASTIGLILLWISGIAMVFGAGVGETFSNFTFLIKLAAVLQLSYISVLANLALARARAAGRPPNAGWMTILGKSATVTAAVTVMLAVVAFN